MVSVIIPVYNVEKYLVQCVDSIINQTYKNIEIILVDDGSFDESPSICDKYKEMDNRIKVIHKANQGLGFARNSGLEIAKGEYIKFIDSDDWASSDMIEVLLNQIESESADLAISGYIAYQDETHQRLCSVTTTKEVIPKEKIVDQILLPIVGAPSDSLLDVEREMCVWTNLYKREIIEKNKLRFVSEREWYSEDFFFNFEYIMKCGKVVLTPNYLNYYRKNDMSLSNKYRPERYFLSCKMMEGMKRLIHKYGLEERIECRLDKLFIMKTRKNLMLIVFCDDSLSEKIKNIRNIVNDQNIIECLERVLIEKYPLEKRIFAQLIKEKSAYKLMIYIHFYQLMKRIMRK